MNRGSRGVGVVVFKQKTAYEIAECDWGSDVCSSYLSALTQKKQQLEQLIDTVTKTIQSLKGAYTMTDQEKFQGLKSEYIAKNEQQYGAEIRARYGDEIIDASNAKLRAMEEATWHCIEDLTEELNQTLTKAVSLGNPSGELAQLACALHKQWLNSYWPEGMYSKQVHKSLADSYVEDARFRASYDKLAPDCAVFLRDAIYIYCAED